MVAVIATAPTRDRPLRRGVQLLVGLALFGASIALMARGGLGLMPWAVLDQGIALRLGIPLGAAVIATGALILLCWIPLRERPGVGTVANVVLVGLAVDATLRLLDHVGAGGEPASGWALMLAGIALNAVATSAYIGARLGAGPRDGLMTGLVRVTGHSVRVVRTSLEVLVVLAGYALGGTVGVGTVLYALSIGPLVHWLLPRLTVPVHGARAVEPVRPADVAP